MISQVTGRISSGSLEAAKLAFESRRLVSLLLLWKWFFEFIQFRIVNHSLWFLSRCHCLTADVLDLLHVVDVLVALLVHAEVALGGEAVITHLAPVRLVATGVGLAARRSRMLLVGDAVNAVEVRVRVLLLHVDLMSLLVFEVLVALKALRGLGFV